TVVLAALLRICDGCFCKAPPGVLHRLMQPGDVVGVLSVLRDAPAVGVDPDLNLWGDVGFWHRQDVGRDPTVRVAVTPRHKGHSGATVDIRHAAEFKFAP